MVNEWPGLWLGSFQGQVPGLFEDEDLSLPRGLHLTANADSCDRQVCGACLECTPIHPAAGIQKTCAWCLCSCSAHTPCQRRV